MALTIRQADFDENALQSAVRSRLISFNLAKTARSNDFRPLMLALEDSGGAIAGGLCGRTGFGWLFVELLFVPEEERGAGIGTALMEQAEAEAIVRGCHSAWLDTFEFQARGFYERLGYSCFGQLNNYPIGQARFFMTKQLGVAKG